MIKYSLVVYHTGNGSSCRIHYIMGNGVSQSMLCYVLHILFSDVEVIQIFYANRNFKYSLQYVY